MHATVLAESVTLPHLAVLAASDCTVCTLNSLLQSQPSIDLINSLLILSILIEEVLEGDLSIVALSLLLRLLIEN